MLSILIPATSPTRLHHTLLSIYNSRVNGIEVIINNAICSDAITAVGEEFGYPVIKKKTNILESRYILARNSSGNYSFLLDDTRAVSEDLLPELLNTTACLAVVREKENAAGLYSRLTNEQNNLIAKYDISLVSPVSTRFILPRMYKTDLLIHSLERIKYHLGTDTFNRLSALDLELIYYQANEEADDIEVIPKGFLVHSGDNRPGEIYKKFYKYGYNTALLRNTHYSELGNLSGRMRKATTLREFLDLCMFTTIRGVPFTIGYFTYYVIKDKN